MAKKQDKALEKQAPRHADLSVPAKAEGRELDHDEQAGLLNEYKASGRNPGYIDQSRDQEPDIAPEFGRAPHPELFNPEPPEVEGVVGRAGASNLMSAPGIGEKSDDPRARLAEEVDEDAEDGADELALAKEEALAEGAGVAVAPGPAQPVVVVADKSDKKSDSKSK